jgi:PAB-dependent poly(A)-specific ribonuclease subunit 3
MRSIVVNSKYFVISCAHLQVLMHWLFSYNDELESELARELENGRLVRLMAKMGFINERPE